MEMAIYEAFREAGIDEKPAKAITSTLYKAIEQSVDSKQLVTKSDLTVEIEKVRAEIARVESNLVKWIFGAIVTAAGLASGIAVVIARLLFTAG